MLHLKERMSVYFK